MSLNFVPTVLAANRISLHVKPEVSQLVTSGSGAIEIGGLTIPGLTVRRAETTIELGSGESFAMAGLMQNTTTNQLTKFPGLGDLPILGPLFRSTNFQRNESELVVIVTPYITEPIADPHSIRLPTDGLAPANDIDRILRGRVAARNVPAAGGSTTASADTPHLAGDAGLRHRIEGSLDAKFPVLSFLFALALFPPCRMRQRHPRHPRSVPEQRRDRQSELRSSSVEGASLRLCRARFGQPLGNRSRWARELHHATADGRGAAVHVVLTTPVGAPELAQLTRALVTDGVDPEKIEYNANKPVEGQPPGQSGRYGRGRRRDRTLACRPCRPAPTNRASRCWISATRQQQLRLCHGNESQPHGVRVPVTSSPRDGWAYRFGSDDGGDRTARAGQDQTTARRVQQSGG